MIKVTMLLGRLSPERNPIPFQLAEGLSKRGFKVEVIAGYPSRGISQEKIDEYRSQPVKAISDNLVIRRVGRYHKDEGSLVSRALDYVRLSRDVYKAARLSGADVFLLYSSPPFLMLNARRLRSFGSVVINVQDLFPDSLLAILDPCSRFFIRPFLHRIMKDAYRSASKIVTISHDMKLALSRYDVNPECINVAYNWANVSEVYYVPPEENPLYDEFGLDRSEKYIVYAGNVGKFQAVENLIELAEVAQEQNADYKFVVVGGGAKLSRIEKMIVNRKLNNVHVFPIQPPDKVKYVYSLGFFNVLSIAPGVLTYAHPSKTAYLLATGVPILGLMEKTSSLSNFILDNQLGCVIPNNSDRKAMIDGLERIDAWENSVSSTGPDNSSRHVKRYCFQQALGVYVTTINESVEAEEARDV